jgi:hypothetical protein
MIIGLSLRKSFTLKEANKLFFDRISTNKKEQLVVHFRILLLLVEFISTLKSSNKIFWFPLKG